MPPGRPRKNPVTVTSRADAVKTANVALRRRLAGNPNVMGRREIPLKEPHRWATYIENTYADENAFYDMKEGGWVPLTPDDLACPVDESGFRLSESGYLVRGPKEQEMVFKMAIEDYRLLEQAKAAVNSRGIGSAKKVKADMAEAGAQQFGGEAGDFLSKMPGQVVDTLIGQPSSE